MNKIFIASDHAGFILKSEICATDWTDLGTNSTASVDYPDFAHNLCKKIIENKGALGVLICGSGVGMSIAANKHPGIRAALVTNTETARLAREHNHANVLCLAARSSETPVSANQAKLIIDAWLAAKPSQDERHLRRIQKLENTSCLTQTQSPQSSRQ